MINNKDVKSIIYYWPEMLLYITSDKGRGLRYHKKIPYSQLSIGLNSSIDIYAKKPATTTVSVGSVLHDVNSTWGEQFADDVVCSLLIDPASRFRALATKRMTHSIDSLQVAVDKQVSIIDFMSTVYTDELSQVDVTKYLYQQFQINDQDDWIRPDMDSRIIAVIRHLQSGLDKRPTSHKLANLACLSESRLQYLFKEEVGVSISRYLLWRRFHRASQVVLAERNLLSGALATGFWDAAHMSHAMKTVLGVAPSQVLRSALTSKRLLVSSMS